MRSIRARILGLVLGVLVLSLTAISLKSYFDAQHEIEELFDAQLAQTARILQGMVGGDMPLATRELMQRALNSALLSQRAASEALPANGHPYEGKLAFQVLDDSGQVLLQSASASADLLRRMIVDLHQQAPQPHAHEREEPLSSTGVDLLGYHTVPLGRYHWRVFMLHDQLAGKWIMVAERDDVRGELVEKIAMRSLLPDLVGLPLLALLVWVAVGMGLLPLQQMVNFLKNRDPDNLAPLVLAPLPSELEPMAASLNRLLQQVNVLLEREKRFLADAAHELRTPLAVLRIHAQNAVSAASAEERDAALAQLIGGVDRATRVVTQLLTLARLEPNAVQLAMQTFDLAAFVRQELAELIPLALERDQELTLDLDETADLLLRGDAPSLGILLQNLVGNALQYTPEGGRIQIALQGQGDSLLLSVQDSGPGVPQEQREQLFQRFYRQGPGQGAGLGQSIVQRIVELHRGEISLHTAALGGLEVRVRLPRH